MSKDWRDGGDYPKISFTQLRDMTNTTFMTHHTVMNMWKLVLVAADAESLYSNAVGGLPAYYSFCETLNQMYDEFRVSGEPVRWYTMAFEAMVQATPANWEFTSCATMEP